MCTCDKSKKTSHLSTLICVSAALRRTPELAGPVSIFNDISIIATFEQSENGRNYQHFITNKQLKIYLIN